jgi:hypothetical protein
MGFVMLPGLDLPVAPRLLGRGRVIAAGLCLALGLVACGVGSTGTEGPAAPTAPTGPSPTPTPTVLYQNALTSSSSGWTNDQNCFFGPDGYHIKGNSLCIVPAGNLKDADITVQVKQVSGATTHAYGLGFRRPSAGSRYEFDIDGGGKWIFYKCAPGTCATVINLTPNAAIKGGLNTPNTLDVRAVGSHFDFSVNGTKVGQRDDTSYPSGEVVLVGDTASEVVFSNLLITKPV